MKNAGSKEAFFKVDYTYCYDLAKRGLQAGADRFFLVSAIVTLLHGSRLHAVPPASDRASALAPCLSILLVGLPDIVKKKMARYEE